jgi:hypothetical protein
MILTSPCNVTVAPDAEFGEAGGCKVFAGGGLGCETGNGGGAETGAEAAGGSAGFAAARGVSAGLGAACTWARAAAGGGSADGLGGDFGAGLTGAGF